MQLEAENTLRTTQQDQQVGLNDDTFGRSVYSSLMRILDHMRPQIENDKYAKVIRRFDERFKEENDQISFGNKLNGSVSPINRAPTSRPIPSESVVIEVTNEHNAPSYGEGGGGGGGIQIGGRPTIKDMEDRRAKKQIVTVSEVPGAPSTSQGIKFTHKDAQSGPFDILDQPLFTISSDSKTVEPSTVYNEPPLGIEYQHEQSMRYKQNPERTLSDPYGQYSTRLFEASTRKRPRQAGINYQEVLSANLARQSARHVRTSPNQQPKYATRIIKYNDHISSSSDESGDEIDESDMIRRPTGQVDIDGHNPTAQPSYQSHRGIVLQQVNPESSSILPTSYQIAPSRDHSQNVYGIKSAASGGLKFLTKSDLAGSGVASTLAGSQNQQVLHDISANHRYPNDLQNQPQTIQVTALPNAGAYGQVNQLVRLNGLPIGLANSGLQNYGISTDAFGRPVLMLNAERRQVEWPTWFYPVLLVVTLPLIFGALFVPLFLKTIIVMLQILQSLGLLLPLTNAMSQQILQATGLTNTTSLLHLDLPKT